MNDDDLGGSDPLLGALAGLPGVGPAPLDRARTLRRARARFLDEQRAGGGPTLRRARHAYSDYVAPALLAGGAAAYLLWALNVCSALGRAG